LEVFDDQLEGALPCPNCQRPLAVPRPEQPRGDRPLAQQTTARPDRLTAGGYVLAIVLPPIGFGVGVAWAVQGFRKALPMLLVSLPMLILWVAGLLGYFVYYNPGDVWEFTPEEEAAMYGQPLDEPPESAQGAEGRSR
jgi:hypothetical protein